MPQGQEDEEPTAAARLAEALETSGISIRALAKQLAGENASDKRVDDVRGYVYRWLRGDGISERYATKLAEILGVPAAYFRPSRPGPSRSVAARLAALEAEVDDVNTALRAAKRANQELQKRVGVLEKAALPQVAQLDTGSTRRGRRA